MKSRHAVALGCSYFLGWALVLAALITAGNYDKPVFLVIEARESAFLAIALTAWFCFTMPCLLVAVAVGRELKPNHKTPIPAHD